MPDLLTPDERAAIAAFPEHRIQRIKPTVDMLRRILRLDEDTGKLYWRARGPDLFRGQVSTCAYWNAAHADREALSYRDAEGYHGGSIFGRTHRRGRVVFAISSGSWPDGEIDHIDGDQGNDRPSNLREASRSENAKNRGAPRGAKSKFKGVCWHNRAKKWQASITHNGVRRHLGTFESEASAANAYDIAAAEWHGAFARLNDHGAA